MKLALYLSKWRNIEKIEFYSKYFEKFYSTLDVKVQDKFIWTFQLIEEIERVPDKYLKHVEDGIYEIRVKHGSNIYRAFSFFDGQKLVITINGFVKKTQKTPKEEIKRAIKIRQDYHNEEK